MRIASLASVKIALTPPPPTEHDAVLAQILEAVSMRMMTAINRELRIGNYVEYFPTPCDFVSLRARPVTSITSIQYEDNVIPVDYYEVDLVRGNIAFLDWVTNVRTMRGLIVTYRGGYAYATGTAVEPELLTATGDEHLATLADAVRRQVCFEYLRRKDLGISTVTMPDGSIGEIESGPWLPSVMDTIGLERRIAIG